MRPSFLKSVWNSALKTRILPLRLSIFHLLTIIFITSFLTGSQVPVTNFDNLAHHDRLCRFGFELIQYMVEPNRRQILVLDQTIHSPESELTAEFISMVGERSRTMVGERSRTMVGERSRTMVGERSRTMVGERSRTMVGERSRTMVGERSRTMVGERSRTMVGERSRTMVGERSRTILHVFSCRIHGLRNYAKKIKEDQTLPHDRTE